MSMLNYVSLYSLSAYGSLGHYIFKLQSLLVSTKPLKLNLYMSATALPFEISNIITGYFHYLVDFHYAKSLYFVSGLSYKFSNKFVFKIQG